MLLQAGSKTQHLGFISSAKRNHLCDGRGRIGQRSGLIEYDGVRIGHDFQKASAFDGDIVSAAFSHGG